MPETDADRICRRDIACFEGMAAVEGDLSISPSTLTFTADGVERWTSAVL